MTKRGSNDLKARARQLAAAEGISYAQALDRLRSGHSAASAAPPARWRHHGATRPGFHWHFTAGSTDLRVDVPDSQNPLWREQLAPFVLDKWDGAVPRFTTGQTDLVLGMLLHAYGRTGRELVEYVDVEIRLDDVETVGRLDPAWAGVRLAYAGEHTSWTAPRLEACELVVGELLLEGRGPQRRITWTPGTVLRVREVPRTSLRGQPADAYTIVASSHDDPNDHLRHAGHQLLGMRYWHDIPPAPADAFAGRVPTMPSDRPATLRYVPTDYPHGGIGDQLAVDPAAGIVYVHRSTMGGYFSEYALPLTDDRAAVIDAYEEAFSRSAAAYAVAGADPQAAARLSGTPFTPQRLYRLLEMMTVADADDAAALTGRTEEEWSTAGWSLGGMTKPVHQPHHELADPAKCWRVTEAAQLAEAGIGAYRAYELRTDDGCVRTVAEVIAQDLAVPNEAGRTAIDLLEKAAETVPEALAVELPTARTHTSVEVEKWSNDHRSPFGPQGSGVSADLTRHDFTLRGGETRSLWAVGEGWWDYGIDADAGHEAKTYMSDRTARAAWREVRDKLRNPQPAVGQPEPELPCPGPDVVHCDNCGSLEVKPNDFLELGWMSASLGRACSPKCYDAMSDVPGRHAVRHHHS
ncbi:hypothetical protein AB0M58_14070 [Streptomyces bobili]|uniref:hypothetical protein n=1 Tax=Streptomyces bobili TaxID=67280 RepID=UPI003427510E